MQSALRSLSVIALTFLSSSSFASTMTYTSAASFLGNLKPGAYTENFNGLGNPPPTTFSGGGFSYSISAPGGLYASGDFLGTNFPYETLTVNFTSGNVTAVGGNFFATNVSDAFFADAVTLTLSDLTTVTFTPTALANSFRGFISTTLITSLTMTVSNVQFESLYASLDNLTVGVPEPSSWMLAGLGLAGLFVARRRTV